MTIRTQAEWMARHLEELVAAIKADGKLCGPRSEPLLDRCARYANGARVARHMLLERLRREGLEGLMAGEGPVRSPEPEPGSEPGPESKPLEVLEILEELEDA